jgi:aminoacrylate hydrolase
MPFAKRGETALYWERHGRGPALILGAGLGGVGSYWTPNLPELTSHFTVYLFDQRGTGKSSIEAVQSIEQMSDDLIAVMDHAELAEATYLGHSTGGAIGVATALDHPARITDMAIYASTTCGDAYRRRILQLRSHIFSALGVEAYAQYTSLLLYPPYWINAHDAELAAAEGKTAGQLGSPEIQASRFDAISNFDRRQELPRIAIPTLVLCADDDILTPRYFSEEYARLIPGAVGRWVERGGHAFSRTEPELFNRIVLDFFKAKSKT